MTSIQPELWVETHAPFEQSSRSLATRISGGCPRWRWRLFAGRRGAFPNRPARLGSRGSSPT
jgi:hypothetical protein